MITPVTLLRMRSSYHFDNLILIRLKSSSQSGNLIRRELQIKLRKAQPDFRCQPKFPFWGFGGEQFKRFLALPKMGSATLLIKASVDKELDKLVKFLKEKCVRLFYAGGSLSADRHCCNIWHLPGSARTAPRSKGRYTFRARHAF